MAICEMTPKVRLLGVEIDNLTMDEAIAAADELVSQRLPAIVVTPNVDHLVKLQDDAEFRQIYKDSSLVLADGVPLLWGARLTGNPLREKISGSDLFPKLCERAATKGRRVFFLGGRPGAAQAASRALQAKHKDLDVAGVYCPPFGFENDAAENEKIVRLILEAKPDILFVGLGAPKQEKWIHRYRYDYKVPVSIGIGISFEYISGMVPRAPVWIQKAGLEWFFRLCSEPGRLWKRYLVDDMRYFWLLLRQILKKE